MDLDPLYMDLDLTLLLPASRSAINHTNMRRDMFGSHMTAAGDKIRGPRFAEILTAAGFDEAEADAMFLEISGGENVSLPAFQEWWKRDHVSDGEREVGGPSARLQWHKSLQRHNY